MSSLTLHEPFKISPRLYVALRIGNAWVEQREQGRFVIAFDTGYEFAVNDLSPGVGQDTESCFVALLSFLGAWAEAVQHSGSDNIDLFPVDDIELKGWVETYDDDISVMAYEIEYSDSDLIEGESV